MDNRETRASARAAGASESLAGRQPTGAADRPTPRVRWARAAFSVLAFLFLICVGVQVFLAGMAIFVSPVWWRWHTRFVHFFELLPILLLALAFVGRLPRGTRWLTIGVFLLLVLQYASINVGRDLGLPAVAALHVVNALLIFWVAAALARGGVASILRNRT